MAPDGPRRALRNQRTVVLGIDPALQGLPGLLEDLAQRWYESGQRLLLLFALLVHLPLLELIGIADLPGLPVEAGLLRWDIRRLRSAGARQREITQGDEF